MEMPLDRAEEFPSADIFAVPPIAEDGTCEPISCVCVPPDVPLPSHVQAVPVRQLLFAFPDCGTSQSARMLRAYHIAQWRKESLFCGSCGSRNGDSPGELSRLCPACGRLEYPRISPAIITLITNDKGQALLAHNKKFALGMYSLIAGFAEAGESLEETVAREVREEVGIGVHDIRYAVSQPWPFPNSLMVGFYARYASGDTVADGVEIDDARWFSRSELPKLPGPGSVARYLIERWLAGEVGSA